MYDIGYHWKIEQIVNSFNKFKDLTVVVDRISRQQNQTMDSGVKSDAAEPSKFSNGPCSSSSLCCKSGVGEAVPSQSCCSRPLSPSCSVPAKPYSKPDFSNYAAVFYIGSESRRLTHLLVTNPDLPVFAIDPSQNLVQNDNACKIQTGRTNQVLMRRYATIQKAADADVFGILIGTLGILNFLELIDQTRDLIETKFKKKCYLISVGKLKPEKLMNFFEIECWVLIDCPENSLLVLEGDQKQFLQPIVTPWELQIALSNASLGEEINDNDGKEVHSQGSHLRRWEGKLVLKFEELLANWKADEENLRKTEKLSRPSNGGQELDLVDGEAPVFSFVTGKYKQRRNWNAEESPAPASGDQQVVLKDSNLDMIRHGLGAASQYDLNHRTFHGLEIGKDTKQTPSLVEPGRFGVAQGYQEYSDDHENYKNLECTQDTSNSETDPRTLGM